MLATDLAGECAAIITGDQDLLILDPFRHVRVLAPSGFWKWESEHEGRVAPPPGPAQPQLRSLDGPGQEGVLNIARIALSRRQFLLQNPSRNVQYAGAKRPCGSTGIGCLRRDQPLLLFSAGQEYPGCASPV